MTSNDPKELFVSMDPESFARSTGPSPEAFRQALLKADADLQKSRPYIPVRRR